MIVGHQGQDGRLLSQLLRQRGENVIGVGRAGIAACDDYPGVGQCFLDQPQTVFETVRTLQPESIYYLAAHHASSQTRLTLDHHSDHQTSLSVNVSGLLHFLEAIRRHSPTTRLFFASSSLIFGNHPQQTPQDESTQISPEETYGFCKALAGGLCRDYRRQHGVFASVGILFNHESCLRSPQFLSMKIIRAAVSASRGTTEKLVVGNLDVVVDWGYAPDYVDAFTRILTLDEPDDFVVATGIGQTVRDFAAAAFGRLGLDWQEYVIQDPSVLALARSGRIGNSSKLRRITNWRPSINFEEMISTLVDQVAQDVQRSSN